MSPDESYGDLEIGLNRLRDGVYAVDLRLIDPASDSEIPPQRGEAAISLDTLADLEFDPVQYGQSLAAQLLPDGVLHTFYTKAKSRFDQPARNLRVRLFIGPSAGELNAIRWELLADRDGAIPLAFTERVFFSRFMSSADWRSIKLRPKGDLRAVVAVSAPTDIEKSGLAPVNVD